MVCLWLYSMILPLHGSLYFYCNCKSSSWDFLFVLISRQAWLWDALISLSNGGDAYLTTRVDLVYVSSRYEYNIDRTIRSLGNKSSYCHMRDYCSWYVYWQCVFLRIFKQDFGFWNSSIAVPLDAHSCNTLVHVISAIATVTTTQGTETIVMPSH